MIFVRVTLHTYGIFTHNTCYKCGSSARASNRHEDPSTQKISYRATGFRSRAPTKKLCVHFHRMPLYPPAIHPPLAARVVQHSCLPPGCFIHGSDFEKGYPLSAVLAFTINRPLRALEGGCIFFVQQESFAQAEGSDGLISWFRKLLEPLFRP